MDTETKKIILIKRPSAEITEECFLIESGVLSDLQQDEVLIRIRYLSVDPYMRNRMNDVRSYIRPYILNEVMEGDGIGEIIESRHAAFKTGDLVYGILPWQQSAVMHGNRIEKIGLIEGVRPTAYLSILGLTGLTAYFGMFEIAKPRAGENVVVSGAAGAVGSIAGQIARLKGCNVTGIVGTAEKADFICNECAFDMAINYRESRNIRKVLRDACPDGVDIYFDNVGGEISDAVFYRLNDFARVVLCGQISLYNQNRLAMGPRLLAQMIIHRVRMQGFIVYDFKDRFPEARKELAGWLHSGEIKNHEQITEGFEKLPAALISLFKGANTGKLLVKI